MNQAQQIENINQFLKELTELSKKHSIFIYGCGCCGSPFLGKEQSQDGQYKVSINICKGEVIFDLLEWKSE